MNSSSRNGAQVIWLGVHTTEGMMRVQTLRDWTGWPGSSHAASDETGALWGPEQGFVPYDRAAWTLRSANPISENIEQCGWAKWTREEWLSRPLMLDATARWLAERSRARGIPLRRLTHAEIRARVPGVLGHGDYSIATGDGTHWDPGPGYPWDVVLDKARAYAAGINPAPEDDMFQPSDAERLTRIENAVAALIGVAGRPIEAEARLNVRLDALTEMVRQLAANHGADLDMAAIEAVVEKGVADAIDRIDTTVHVKPA